MKCEGCIHKEVCKHKEEFEKKYNELNNEGIFEVELKCKHFDDGADRKVKYVPVYPQSPTIVDPWKNPCKQPTIKWYKNITVTGL